MRHFGVLALATFLCLPSFAEDYLIGSGIYDITGPPADIVMMGYVSPSQKTSGISLRLRARSFVIADNSSRVAIVTIDQIHVYDAVTTAVVKKLQKTFGNLYSEQNLLISATHSHSAPGGYSRYKLYDFFSSLGFSQQNFDVIVDGIYQSIVRAHQNLAPGEILYAEGEVSGTNFSRSSDAYLLNPAQERAQYAHNVDKEMKLLKFVRADGKEIGELNWFALHGTSMKVENHLISSDNKGYAAYSFEKEKGTNYFSRDTFVAAFANSNAGDASPSDGKTVTDQGDWTCALNDSFKCTEASGRKQFLRAKELYDGANERLTGAVDFRHTYVDMSNVEVAPEFTGNGLQATCAAAVGLSMLAGTKDHWGVGKEKQSCSDPTLLGSIFCLRPFECQGVKPVALKTGSKATPWTPQILPIQIIRVGQLALVAVPAEFTTMSGRRVRQTVENALRGLGVNHVVLAGYANSYAGYVATPEEYQMQNYEGASTHFNEWTLPAYQQELYKLAVAMVDNHSVPPGPSPLDLTDDREREIPRMHLRDTTPIGKDFGDVEVDAEPRYRIGDIVSVQFWGGYPNNNLLTQSSYLEVQRKEGSGWRTVAYDGDWETKFIYEQVGRTSNKITIEWQTRDAVPGTYRVLHRGHSKALFDETTPYQGMSRKFTVE